MPLLQKQLSDYFPSAEILNTLSPDEVIAIGASKQVRNKENHLLPERVNHSHELTEKTQCEIIYHFTFALNATLH